MDKVVLKQQFQELEKVHDDENIAIVEYEWPNWNKEVICDNCKQTKYFNGCCRTARDDFTNGRRRRKGKWVLLEEPYHPGHIPKRHKCMPKGTSWKNRTEEREKHEWVPDSSNFYKDCVVREKENNITKNAKIERWMKLTNYKEGKDERTLANLLLAKKWKEYTFEY